MPRYAFLAALIGALSLTALIGARAATDPQLLQPSLIEVEGDRRLHLACVGSGSPTVVFEQGADGSIANWRRVQPQVSALTRTCFYDRAGFGLSDPARDVVTGISVTDDLRRLLRAAKIDEPVVLVGHAIGGFYATLYASRFPQNVAGLVLIEPSFEGQFATSNARQRTREQQALLQGEALLRKCGALAREGKLSAAAPQGCFTLAPDLSPHEAAYVTAMSIRAARYDAELNQSLNFFPHGEANDSLNWAQARLARRELGAMPLVVLSAETSPRERVQNDAAYREASQRWKDGHRQLSARSPSGEWREVPASGHFIQLDQPAAVMDAIQNVVLEVRRTRPIVKQQAPAAKAAKAPPRPKARPRSRSR
jgi:pimeloyl-ACP methyl ester carboxylesterase